MTSGAIPQLGFLFSIAGLSLSLAGFSGLVAAFRRGDGLRPVDAYRLRQIPEMGLATALVVLVTIPLADTTGSSATAVRIAGCLALVFTILHIVALSARGNRRRFRQLTAGKVAAGFIRVAIGVTSAFCIALGSAAAFEWLLVFLLARPMLAFVMVLTDVGADETPRSSSAAPASNRPTWRQQNAVAPRYLRKLSRGHPARDSSGTRNTRV